ncbi:MAG: 3-deoxy-8-phosphooctulonate synthase [Halanaerobiales bacterium]
MVEKVKKVKLNSEVIFGDSNSPFVLIAGPCVLESKDSAFQIAQRIKNITTELGIPYVFKSSYDKANRSSINSYRGPGVEKGLKILKQIKNELHLPVITDIHTPSQAEKAKKVVDIIQIPAFLSRQTDLIVAAGETDKIVNIKKGQFLSPWEIDNVIEKIESTGNEKILLTERGSSFGYNNLVVDMRSLVRMRETGYPVVFDATHSVQLPGGKGDSSAGQRKYAAPLARAALGVGIDAVFMEVHSQPEKALCDGPNMIKLKNLETLLSDLLSLDEVVRKRQEA